MAVKNKVSHEHAEIMWEYASSKLQDVGMYLQENRWQIIVVSSIRGWCKYGTKEITIPLWAINKGKEYSNWYLAHEMAHAMAFMNGNIHANHGPEFMAELKAICPVESLHFETGYKSRNAASAGISKFAFENAAKQNNGVIPTEFIPKDF